MRSYTSLIRHQGNQELLLFTELAIIGVIAKTPLHLHVEGLRGTGKTTILRAASSLLPLLYRIKGCMFNCDPNSPHCPRHHLLQEDEAKSFALEQVTIPFFEISHSAKIGTVTGTLDLTALTDTNRPEAAILPGTLPRAHRGIVLVDEINRLADTAPELTDILLDAMGTKPGRVQIEENGLPTVALPLEVSIWASSNPDEDPGSLADIRRQLSDRFDFMVQMKRPLEVGPLLAILNQDCKTKQGLSKALAADIELGLALARKATRVQDIMFPAAMLESIAEIYIKHHLESIRALEAIKTGAALHTVHRDGCQVGWDDVLAVTPAALRHRLDPEQLAAVLKDLQRERGLLDHTAAAAGSNLVSVDVNRSNPSSVSNTGKRGCQQEPGRWHRLIAWFRRLLSRKHDRYPKENRIDGSKAGRAAASGGGSKTSSQPGNPLDMPLVAPPSVAMPLWELDLEDSIIEGEVDDAPNH
ncbi:MAG TPA: magnesium chelatase [bacterium]|nr:magnesium chelatase [bacterium]